MPDDSERRCKGCGTPDATCADGVWRRGPCCRTCCHVGPTDSAVVDPEVAVVRALAVRTNELVTCYMIGDHDSIAMGADLARNLTDEALGPLALQLLAAQFASAMRYYTEAMGEDAMERWRDWCQYDVAKAAGLDPDDGGAEP